MLRYSSENLLMTMLSNHKRRFDLKREILVTSYLIHYIKGAYQIIYVDISLFLGRNGYFQ